MTELNNYDHKWVRDYDIVDHSCLYCSKCKMWYAMYIKDGYPDCTS